MCKKYYHTSLCHTFSVDTQHPLTISQSNSSKVSSSQAKNSQKASSQQTSSQTASSQLQVAATQQASVQLNSGYTTMASASLMVFHTTMCLLKALLQKYPRIPPLPKVINYSVWWISATFLQLADELYLQPTSHETISVSLFGTKFPRPEALWWLPYLYMPYMVLA